MYMLEGVNVGIFDRLSREGIPWRISEDMRGEHKVPMKISAEYPSRQKDYNFPKAQLLVISWSMPGVFEDHQRD